MIQDYAIKFARENGGVVLIDCLEYLLTYNDFSNVFKFLINLKDQLLLLGASFIIAADEKAIGEREYRILLNEFEPL